MKKKLEKKIEGNKQWNEEQISVHQFMIRRTRIEFELFSTFKLCEQFLAYFHQMNSTHCANFFRSFEIKTLQKGDNYYLAASFKVVLDKFCCHFDCICEKKNKNIHIDVVVLCIANVDQLFQRCCRCDFHFHFDEIRHLLYIHAAIYRFKCFGFSMNTGILAYHTALFFEFSPAFIILTFSTRFSILFSI